MKIPLRFEQDAATTEAGKAKALEADILAAGGGDWNARARLVTSFLPLLRSLAEKRSSEVAEINKLIEAGKEGLFTAAHKHKKGAGADQFRIFALDFIESAMNRKGKAGGFFSRLFG